jgi:hypothetical protein
MKYEKLQVKGTFFAMRGFYLFFIPLFVPYKKITSKAQELGLKVKGNGKFNGIIEKGMAFGFGWIGIEIEEGPVDNKNIIKINQEFSSYEYRGEYKNIGTAYRNIMTDKPEAKEFYNLYLNDPSITPLEERKTLILFR